MLVKLMACGFLLAITALLAACGGSSGVNNAGISPTNESISSNGITVRVSREHAGAITSLRYRGVEYIDDGYRHPGPGRDRGRNLQTANSYNNKGEGDNPTEAGSSSTHNQVSNLLGLSVTGNNTLATTTRMANWNPVNGIRVSETVLHKNVRIGHGGMPNVIRYDVQLDVPAGKSYAVNEVLTAYLRPEFTRFLELLPAGTLQTVNVGGAKYSERSYPVILATPDDSSAMGFVAVGLPQPAYPAFGYGSFSLNNGEAKKINAVFRESLTGAPQTFRYRIFVVVGTTSEVQAAMRRL